MLLAVEPQASRIYVSPQTQGIVKPSKPPIRVREIALHDEDAAF